MPLFPHAQNFSINGGDFSEVNGNQNHYHGPTNPLHVHGDNNSTTFVDGPYHNGPDNSISNEAGGDIHIIGQGEDCQVNMGSMDDLFSILEASSRSSTRQHNTRTPAARSNSPNHHGSNSGISNRAGGNVRVFGQGRGSLVQLGINAHLAQQSMRTRNGLYSPTQEYGVEDRYSPQYLHPSQSQYGANFQHQMRSQHPKGWCDPPMEYYPQSPQQATFNRSVPSSPPPEVYRANSPSQKTGYPSGNYQYDWRHHNVPSSPPIGYPPPTSPPSFERTSYPAANHQMWNTPQPGVSPSPQFGYPPPTSPPPSQATSYLAENNQYMGYHAPPHPGLSSSPPAPQLPTTRYSSDNNQYAPYQSRPSISLATTTSAPPTPSLPSEPVRAPVQSPPGTLPVNPAPARAPTSAPISVPALPQSHQPLPNTSPTPSTAPAEQGAASQEFATVEVATPAAVFSPADAEDTTQSPLPVDTVHMVHSRPQQEEQPPLAAPRPVVAGALTDILSPGPVTPTSALPSVNPALPAPATQRVELQDALRPPFTKSTSSQVSASTLVAESVSAESQETPARLGNGSIISDSSGPTAIVTESVLPGTSKIKSTSQEVLPEEADAKSKAEITTDLPISKSKLKAKKWRRMVHYINRQAKKFKKVQVKE